MRLDKFLGETTELTRSLAKKALHREEVLVDGVPIKNPTVQVDERNVVTWQGQRLELVGLRYLMLNKPSGVECTSRRGLYPLVTDLIDLPKAERLQTAGRLDVDTTGLVLLTDDGQWIHRITSPRKRCAKLYDVTLADPLEGRDAESAIETFRQGLLLEGEDKPTRPASLELSTPYHARLSIEEGKYHQVKRMFAAIGNRVERLHRHAIGELELDPSLAPGECRKLTPEEVASF